MRRAMIPGLLILVVLTLSIGSWPLPASASATLIHHYTFNGNVNDQVGGANGVLIGGATAAGGVLSLDGASGYVQFGGHIVPVSGSYSIALFAQETAPTGTYVEFISQGFSGGPGFYLGHDPVGFIRASDAWGATGVLFPTDGKRHHIALVVDSTANRSGLYVDGALKATFIAFTTTPGGSNTRLGRQFDPFSEFFYGSLSDVRIYDGALTSNDVADLASRNPAGSRAYVANVRSDSISVIDTSTNTVLATVMVGANPVHVAVAPNGAAYVTSAGANSVSVIDTATNTVVATVPVGAQPVDVTVTPDGSKAYVTNAGANTVSVIDTTTNAVIATVTVGPNPVSVAITPDGTKAYVTNGGANSVSVISTATNAVVATVPVGLNPVNIVVP